MKIAKSDKIVQLAASATLGTADVEAQRTVNEFAAELMKDFSPQNRHLMAELVRFTVENAVNERTGYFDTIGTTKSIGDNDEAVFEVEYDNSFAVIQADNATTPRWMPGTKSLTIPTVEVSSRFRVNMYDIRGGAIDLGRLTQRASVRMEEAMAAKIMEVLKGAYRTGGDVGAAPFYAEGSGIVSATLDPQVRYFQRYGGVTLLGDMTIMDKLILSQGWVSDEMRNEYYSTGRLGKYKGTNAVQLPNSYAKDGVTTTMDQNLLFIVPNGYESPLKIVTRGEVLAMEATDINTAHFDLVLRRRFGAAVIFGNVPMLGIYKDTAIS